MGKRSTLDSLPDEVLNAVYAAIDDGMTYDAIVGLLAEAGHTRSRSAVGRFAKDYAKTSEALRQSREMTARLAAELGESAVEGAHGRLLVEMARKLAFDHLMRRVEAGEDTELDAKEFMQFSQGLGALARAARSDQTFELRVREMVAKEVAEKAERAEKEVAKIAQEKGLDDATIAELRQKFLGIRVDASAA